MIVVEPQLFSDERGFFMECYKRSEFEAHGIDAAFVQENHSRSSRHVLRGLHYQRPPRAQAKLVRVTAGAVFDVVVDLRPGSPTWGRWVGVRLSAANRCALYVPAGCAHGFCVVSDSADVVYKTSDEYAAAYEDGIRWDDPSLAIRWPVRDPILSERDRRWPVLGAAA